MSSTERGRKTRGHQHEFCAKMKFPAQKNKNTPVNGTTAHAVIVGPKCLIAHLLAPHDRAFSQRLKSRSIDELKSLLRAKKMKLSGTKTDLIARLVSNAIGVDEGGSAKGASRLNQAQLNMIKVRWPFQWLCCSLCTTNSSRSAPTVITQVAEHRKDLNAHVRTLAKMVDDDWHDGWEEQGHELQVSV